MDEHKSKIVHKLVETLCLVMETPDSKMGEISADIIPKSTFKSLKEGMDMKKDDNIFSRMNLGDKDDDDMMKPIGKGKGMGMSPLPPKKFNLDDKDDDMMKPMGKGKGMGMVPPPPLKLGEDKDDDKKDMDLTMPPTPPELPTPPTMSKMGGAYNKRKSFRKRSSRKRSSRKRSSRKRTSKKRSFRKRLSRKR